MLGGDVTDRSVVVLAERGSSGGGGLYLARHLHNWEAVGAGALFASAGGITQARRRANWRSCRRWAALSWAELGIAAVRPGDRRHYRLRAAPEAAGQTRSDSVGEQLSAGAQFGYAKAGYRCDERASLLAARRGAATYWRCPKPGCCWNRAGRHAVICIWPISACRLNSIRKWGWKRRRFQAESHPAPTRRGWPRCDYGSDLTGATAGKPGHMRDDGRHCQILLLGGTGLLLLLVGLAGSVIPVLPGPLFIWLGALLWAWGDGFGVGWPTLVVLGLLALLSWATTCSKLGDRATPASWKTHPGLNRRRHFGQPAPQQAVPVSRHDLMKR